MKITKRQLRRIIKEAAPAYRLDNYERKKNQSLKSLMNSIDSQIMFVQGQLGSGQYDLKDMFDYDFGHIAGLADLIDAAKEKAAEEGVSFVEPDTSRLADHEYRGKPVVVSRWSMNENVNKGAKMKITKRQLRRIIKEEKAKLQEAVKAERYYGIEDKLVNLVLDMEDIPDDQLNDVINRMSDTGLEQITKLLAKMALQNKR